MCSEFSSHRQSSTGSVVVTATCATSPLSQITCKTKKIILWVIHSQLTRTREGDGAYSISMRDVETTLISWSSAAEGCAQQLSDQEELLNWLPHTPLETASPQALGISLPMAEGDPCKEKNKMDSEEQEKYLRSYQPGRTLCKEVHRTVVPVRKEAESIEFE